MTTPKIESAVNTWKWLADPANSEPQPPIEETPEDRALTNDARRFSINALHKSGQFPKSTRADVDEVLNLLEAAGVVGAELHEATAGRPRQIRHVADEWLCADNDQAFAKLEAKLTERLTEIVLKAETVPPQPVSTETDKPEDPRIDLALSLFDWFSDPEHLELDGRNRPVFSVELCRRHLEVDKPALEESLRLLERETVIQRPYKEPNVRSREMRTVNSSWLERGGRQRLHRIFKPEPPKPYIPFGAGRVLRKTDVYVGKQLLSFHEGDIVRDEAHIQALLSAGSIVKLNDANARICAGTRCAHKFDASDSPALDYTPLVAIRRDQFFQGGVTVWLNPGDLITDRSRCLFLATPSMKERVRHSVRALNPDEFLCCPRCHRVSMRSADLQKSSCAQ